LGQDCGEVLDKVRAVCSLLELANCGLDDVVVDALEINLGWCSVFVG
jgi:hypothetical protein